jgi:hypothetical protein
VCGKVVRYHKTNLNEKKVDTIALLEKQMKVNSQSTCTICCVLLQNRQFF